MPPFLPLLLTPTPPPPLTLPARPPAAAAGARRGRLQAAAASSRQPHRRVYRRPRDLQPAPPSNAAPWASPGARDEEELEEAIYDFMRRSDKPGAFPTRAELIAAGRADLAAAVEASAGWLSLGWSSSDYAREGAGAVTAGASSGGAHPDYPPEVGAYDLASGAAREEEPSPSGREPETEETTEMGFGTGLEGMLTRLQRERERARPLPKSTTREDEQCDNAALMGNNGAPSHTATGGRYPPKSPENGNIRSSHSQNGTIEYTKAWRTWSLDKGGFSDFQAAEVHSTNSRKSFKHDDLDIVLAQDDIHGPPNGVAINDYPSNGVDSEREDISSRLQNLEVDLTSALHTLRSRFDKVISDMSNANGENTLNGVSDDWEFEETKVMQAQEELRSIRAKIAVLEGKMALEIIARNKIIEEKQRRLDEAEKALSELRTVYIVWSNPASEVLLTGSFDGWTSQRRMERSERGTFSINLRLYPGRYEIKFIVDGIWKNDPLRPIINNNGHENNLLTVS